MRRYDVHQHLWPPPLVDALRRRPERPRLRGDVLELDEGSFPVDLRDHDLERRLALLDRDGIDVAVVSLPPTLGWERHPELADAFHEGVVELARAAEGRLLLYGSDVPVVDPRATLRALAGLGEDVERAAASANPGRLFA